MLSSPVEASIVPCSLILILVMFIELVEAIENDPPMCKFGFGKTIELVCEPVAPTVKLPTVSWLLKE